MLALLLAEPELEPRYFRHSAVGFVILLHREVAPSWNCMQGGETPVTGSWTGLCGDHSLSMAAAVWRLSPREQPYLETGPGGASLQLLRTYSWGTRHSSPLWVLVEGGGSVVTGFGCCSDFGVHPGHLLPLSSRVALWSGEQKVGQHLETISAGLGWRAVTGGLL